MSEVSAKQHDALAEAERINEERMEVMRQLAAQVAHRHDLERQVTEAEKEEKKLTAAAEKAGWTRRQVQRVVKPPKQPRTSSNGQPSTSSAARSEDDPEQSQTDTPSIESMAGTDGN